jgi:hypothetical protein
MEEMEDEEDEEDNEEQQPTVSCGEFHTYDYGKFLSVWDSYGSFSVICDDQFCLKLVIDNGNLWIDMVVMPGKEESHIEKNGMTYSYFDFKCEKKLQADPGRIRYGCVMLPLLSDKGSSSDDRIYTVIRSDWRVWNGIEFEYMAL